MTTLRTWGIGDAEPDDHPVLIDADGSRWFWCEYDDLDCAFAADEPAGNWWCEDGDSDLWEWNKVLEYAPLREATAEEATRGES